MHNTIIGSIITDCADDNARARQELRFTSLFGVQPTFTGVGSYSPIEAAGNLLDQLDVLSNFPLASQQVTPIILVNVAPRGEDIAARWDNGTPFYYAKIGNILLAGTYEEQCLALLRDHGLLNHVALLDIPEVTQAAVAWGDLTPQWANRINHTQFRSLEFLPLAAYWIWRGRAVPSKTISLQSLPEVQQQVWLADNFGDIKTTLLASAADFRPGKQIRLANDQIATCYTRLADVPQEVTALTIGSSGYGEQRFLEVVVGHRGSAASKHQLSIGGPVLQKG